MRRIDLKGGYSCNNNCLFCIIGNKRLTFDDRTTYEMLMEIKKAAENKFDKIVLTGGEITIRKDFFKIIKFAKKQGFKIIHVESNGAMFHYPEFAKKTVESGATHFTISWHSINKEDYAKITRTSEDRYAKLLDGIKNLRKYSSNIGINCTINKINFKKLKDIVDICKEYRIKSLNFPFINLQGNALENKELVSVDFQTLRPFLLEAIEYAKSKGVNATTEMIPPCVIPEHTEVIEELRTKNMQISAIDYFDEDFAANQKKGRKKSENCSLCIFDKSCDGVMNSYMETFQFLGISPVLKQKK